MAVNVSLGAIRASRAPDFCLRCDGHRRRRVEEESKRTGCVDHVRLTAVHHGQLLKHVAENREASEVQATAPFRQTATITVLNWRDVFHSLHSFVDVLVWSYQARSFLLSFCVTFFFTRAHWNPHTNTAQRKCAKFLYERWAGNIAVCVEGTL